MMSSRSFFTVIAMTISMISFMTENVQAHAACATELRAFGYKGTLHEDTHFFEFNEIDSAKSLPGYRAFVDYIDDRIFSTNSNILDVYCNIVEFIFEKGFTGALPIDRKVSAKAVSGRSDKETAYIGFVSSDPYSKYETKEQQFVFDMVYEFGLKDLTPTAEGANCKKALKDIGYTGQFVNDFLIFKSETKLPENMTDETENFIMNYHILMLFAKDFVLFTDNNIMDVFCDLLEPLKRAGYKGDIDTDIIIYEKLEDQNVYKEEAKIYDGYLRQVNNPKYKYKIAYTTADLRTSQSYLNRFGLFKLGKILY